MKTVEQIIKDSYHRRLRNESHESWTWIRCFAGMIEGRPARDVVLDYLAAGNRVKSGYTTTQIRGYHDKWILVKKP